MPRVGTLTAAALILLPIPRPNDGAEPPAPAVAAPAARRSTVFAADVKITVLSTMLAGNPDGGVGEWGFAALVEVDGRKLLFDTGARPDLVLHNARELGIDLAEVTDVILSHNHDDHVGGLVTLRRELRARNPAALSRAHVATGIFWSRVDGAGKEDNGLLPIRKDYEALGGSFVEHRGPAELLPGVWFTGPVTRKYPERNWSGSYTVKTPTGAVEDNIPEDASLVIDTADGLILLSGCGHAGIVNTVEFAQEVVRRAPVRAAVGGFHLFRADEKSLAWTAAKLKDAGLVYLLGAHCTGLEAVYRIRELAGLSRQNAVVSAVGSSYRSGRGIDPLALAR
ncbi:MAG: MBL fold metallo-hydrolase [Gemmatimonadales bacterium]